MKENNRNDNACLARHRGSIQQQSMSTISQPKRWREPPSQRCLPPSQRKDHNLPNGCHFGAKKKKARGPLHAHREASALANEIPEESEQFRFLRAACYANIKGSVGLILAKASAIRISIPLDLSSRSFIPPSSFMRSRRASTLLPPSLVFTPR